jgi:hypothetical protein
VSTLRELRRFEDVVRFDADLKFHAFACREILEGPEFEDTDCSVGPFVADRLTNDYGAELAGRRAEVRQKRRNECLSRGGASVD